jgi:hypothetical protein
MGSPSASITPLPQVAPWLSLGMQTIAKARTIVILFIILFIIILLYRPTGCVGVV